MNTQNRIFFNGTQLKVIAMITMTLDHFAAVLLPAGSTLYVLFRAVGRLAFPLYCFLLAEGYFHTKNHAAYLKRLFLFAFISEIPFDLALFGFSNLTNLSVTMRHQNVFFTLFAGLAVLYFSDRISFGDLKGSLLVICTALLSELLHFDYGCYGIFMIFLFYAGRRYKNHENPLRSNALALLPLLLAGQTNGWMILLVLPLLQFYNGQKGRMLPGMKYLFYAYYPLHLLIFAILANF